MKPIPDYGDLFTLDEFIKMCEEGGFIDYDGSGTYATATEMSDKGIVPSDVTGKGEKFNMDTGEITRVDVPICIDRSFSHVVWFNK